VAAGVPGSGAERKSPIRSGFRNWPLLAATLAIP
jgi:hypothetical protein